MSQSDNETSDIPVTYALKIAVLIRAVRNGLCLSQEELARLAGSSRPTINRVETVDSRSPRSESVENMLDVFRAMGVEITLYDEEVNIRMTKQALQSAAMRLGVDHLLKQNEQRKGALIKQRISTLGLPSAHDILKKLNKDAE